MRNGKPCVPRPRGLDPRLEELASRADSLTPEEMRELGEAMVRYVRGTFGKHTGSIIVPPQRKP